MSLASRVRAALLSPAPVCEPSLAPSCSTALPRRYQFHTLENTPTIPGFGCRRACKQLHVRVCNCSYQARNSNIPCERFICAGSNVTLTCLHSVAETLVRELHLFLRHSPSSTGSMARSMPALTVPAAMTTLGSSTCWKFQTLFRYNQEIVLTNRKPSLERKPVHAHSGRVPRPLNVHNKDKTFFT